MGGQDREAVLGPVGQGGGWAEGWYRELTEKGMSRKWEDRSFSEDPRLMREARRSPGNRQGRTQLWSLPSTWLSEAHSTPFTPSLSCSSPSPDCAGDTSVGTNGECSNRPPTANRTPHCAVAPLRALRVVNPNDSHNSLRRRTPSLRPLYRQGS